MKFDYSKWKLNMLMEQGDSWDSTENIVMAVESNFPGKWNELSNDFREMFISRYNEIKKEINKNRDILLSFSNIPERYFEINNNYENKFKAINESMPFVLVRGNHGCDKTAAICSYVVRNISSLNHFYYITAGQYHSDCLINEMTFDKGKNSSVFILDDLGIENVAGWDRNYIIETMKHRIDNNKKFIFITTLDDEELKKKYPIIFTYCKMNLIKVLQFASNS